MEVKINEKEAVFSLNTLGEASNASYMGNFRVRCVLTPLQEISADRRYRELLGTNSHLASERVRQQAFALSQLEQRIIENPPFWDNDFLGGGHIEDTNIILEVLDQSIEAQEDFVKLKKEELKERQDRLTQMIRDKTIEKEPDENNVDENNVDEEIEIET